MLSSGRSIDAIFYVKHFMHAHFVRGRTDRYILVTKILWMEKEQKQELGWRVSVLPIPAFHHCELRMCYMYAVYV